MKTALFVLALFFNGLMLGVLVVLVLRALAKKRWPCYRCGGPSESDCEYMGLHYCHICRDVVVMMLPAVHQDPPYGFPGSPGYLEFPKKEFKG